MAVIYEDFIRCKECGSGDFTEEIVFTFHNKLRPRNDISLELDYQDREIHYKCRDCGKELNL